MAENTMGADLARSAPKMTHFPPKTPLQTGRLEIDFPPEFDSTCDRLTRDSEYDGKVFSLHWLAVAFHW